MASVILRILSGAHLGAEIELTPGTWVIGRDDSCDIILTDSSIAARHAALRITDAGVLEFDPLDGTILTALEEAPEDGMLVAGRIYRLGGVLFAWGVADSRDEFWNEVERSLAELSALGARAEALFFDVTDRAGAAKALTDWVEANGAPWGVVLNAGVNRDGPLAGMPDEDWDDVIRTDLDGFFNVMKPLVLPMARRRRGRIVVMSSVSGIAGTRGQTNYSAAKAGLIGAAKALSTELASRGITVNVIAPGLIDTQMATEADRERILPYIPMRRLGRPEEVAGLAAFLLSDEAGYITRAVIPVSGGLL